MQLRGGEGRREGSTHNAGENPLRTSLESNCVVVFFRQKEIILKKWPSHKKLCVKGAVN